MTILPCDVMCVRACVHVFVLVCLWRPEVDLEYLPLLLPIIFLETGSLTGPRAHELARLADK